MRLAWSCLACLRKQVSDAFNLVVDRSLPYDRRWTGRAESLNVAAAGVERQTCRMAAVVVLNRGNLLYQSLSGVLAHLLNLLTASSWAHSAGVAVVILLLFELNMGAVARYYDGAAGLPAS